MRLEICLVLIVLFDFSALAQSDDLTPKVGYAGQTLKVYHKGTVNLLYYSGSSSYGGYGFEYAEFDFESWKIEASSSNHTYYNPNDLYVTLSIPDNATTGNYDVTWRDYNNISYYLPQAFQVIGRGGKPAVSYISPDWAKLGDTITLTIKTEHTFLTKGPVKLKIISPNVNKTASIQSFKVINDTTISVKVKLPKEGEGVYDFYIDGAMDHLKTNNQFSGYLKIYRHYFYPNPAQNEYNIKLSNDNDNFVSVFDLSGKKVLSDFHLEGGKPQALDISNFKSGIYYIRISSVDGIEYAKFVKL